MGQMTEAKKNELAIGMFNDDAGMGMEQTDSDSFAIPFLSILQSGSPQCKKSEGEYIKGAEEGMFFDSVTLDIFDGEEGLYIVPCHFHRRMVEWGLRESAEKGFKGEHVPDHAPIPVSRDEKGRDILDNGNQLVDTRYHFVLYSKDGKSWHAALVTLSSTQMKKSRRWMSVMKGISMERPDGSTFNPPSFSHIYKAVSVPESNDKGSWMGWKIDILRCLDPSDPADMALYAKAKEFRDSVVSGDAEVKYAEAGTDEDDEY